MQCQLKPIAENGRQRGIVPAFHCATPRYAATANGWGYRMTEVGWDVRLLATGAAAAVAPKGY
jgi:2-keto-3-deoxy-L-rhamnonate aldolase RhmA